VSHSKPEGCARNHDRQRKVGPSMSPRIGQMVGPPETTITADATPRPVASSEAGPDSRKDGPMPCSPSQAASECDLSTVTQRESNGRETSCRSHPDAVFIDLKRITVGLMQVKALCSKDYSTYTQANPGPTRPGQMHVRQRSPPAPLPFTYDRIGRRQATFHGGFGHPRLAPDQCSC